MIHLCQRILNGKDLWNQLKRSYWYIIAIYLLMQIGGAFLTVFLNLVFHLDYMKTAVVINIFGFSIVVIIVLRMLWPELREERITKPLSVGTIIGWSALGIMMAWIAQTIAGMLELAILGTGPDSANTQMIVEISRMNPIFILVPALVGPILEELIFRKIIFGTLYKRFNFFISAIVSSLIFSVAHMEFVHILVYAAMGFVFAFLYVKTKRIIIPIIVHMSLNTIAVLGQLFIDFEKLEKMQEQSLLILFGG